ncbi:Uncharacterised protein [Metamycoplasma alkalescens]|uniref:Uncharacterized protein n=1 Tax=Metamycoplasma alkalescens TaxID=45363 RepID=A0A3B0P5E4_9BACT|nr:Uncharacterised protein [Metamycoplasma alkalescens]
MLIVEEEVVFLSLFVQEIAINEPIAIGAKIENQRIFFIFDLLIFFFIFFFSFTFLFVVILLV